MWGCVPGEVHASANRNRPIIWLHAVSVGETTAARPIARALRRRLPNCRIMLSNTTDTGHEVAGGMIKAGEADALFFFPLDLPFTVTRCLNAVRPDAVILLETELWPNLLHLARRRNVVTVLANGRVSDSLLKNARRAGPLWQWMAANLSAFLMRDQKDADRLLSLGITTEKVFVVGDVKLEAPLITTASLRLLWRERLGLRDEPLLVAGSTHDGEEEMLLHCYQRLLPRYPRLRLVLAPRHPERCTAVASLCHVAGIEVTTRSSGQPSAAGAVFLLDTVGKLADIYAAADVSFVGGSLIERGGHNMIEPLLRGAPVLFGPHVMNFRSAAAFAIENQLGQQVQDASELEATLIRYLGLPEARELFEGRVATALEPHQGAAARIADWVAHALEARGASIDGPAWLAAGTALSSYHAVSPPQDAGTAGQCGRTVSHHICGQPHSGRHWQNAHGPGIIPFPGGRRPARRGRLPGLRRHRLAFRWGRERRQ